MNNGYSAAEKNYALCRKDLDMLQNGNFLSAGYEASNGIQFLKVNGLADFWQKDAQIEESVLVRDILTSSLRFNVPFCYAIVGDDKGIHIYLGTMKILRDSLRTSYEAMFPGIDIDDVEGNPFAMMRCQYGGMFTGFPTDKLGAEKKSLQIENICRGMQGKNFVYMVVAVGMGSNWVTLGHDRILQEMEATFTAISQTISGGAMGNMSAQRQDFNSKNYFENLEILEQQLKVGEARGMWRVGGYYAADNAIDGRRLGNIIKASFSGDDSKPETFRVLEYNNICEVIANQYLLGDPIPNMELHPLGIWRTHMADEPVKMYCFKFQTILNSDQLATLCQLPTKEFPGFYVDSYVEFDVSNRVRASIKQPVPIGEICIAGRKAIKDTMNRPKGAAGVLSNQYVMEKNDLTRHTLIIGITGGGKTNTTKSILRTLWDQPKPEDRVPFLVIESAKREYWELRNQKGFEDILVFTLGAEASATSVKYRINPFETNPGISLQTHIDYLLSTFKAAFEMSPPMPYLLEKAVYEVYSDRGWDIVENVNRYGLTQYPTLSDLYHKIDVVVDRMGYHQELRSNVKAALQARINSLMIGGKGAMLNTPKSVPIDQLLNRPVIMELEDLGDDETKSFVIGILLVQLYEYRKSQMTKGSKALSHILMVEEAHRLLKNVPDTGDGGNSRAKSVEFFCNLLAEIRTFGQGIIIADQIPTKLAPDTIKNTNLKIVHRTVAQEDRDTIGRAMNMNEEQIEYLSSLPRGCAAIYAEGDNRPKCVLLPYVKADFEYDRPFVIREVQQKVQSIAAGYDEVIDHHAGCTFCEQRCRYYEKIRAYTQDNAEKILKIWNAKKFTPRSLAAFLEAEHVRQMQLPNAFAQRCLIGHILSFDKSLNEGQRQKILADLMEYQAQKH